MWIYPIVKKINTPIAKKNQEGIDENVKENNIKYNIDEEELFNLVINNSFKLSNGFYEILENLGLLYKKNMLEFMEHSKIQMLKDIIYVLYDLYSGEFNGITTKLNRETLLNLYILSTEHTPDDLLNYYKRTIINKYTNNST